MKQKLLAAVAAVAVMGAGSAAAQSSFNGGYAGLKLGYGSANYDVDYAQSNTSLTYEGLGSEGFTGGVLAGYGRVFGQNESLYLGGEVDLSLSNITSEASASDGTNSASFELTERYSGFGTVRAGFIPMDNWMVFGRTGVGFTNTELDVTYNNASASEDETELTYLVGAGIEGFVTDNVSLRLDYSYRIQDDQESAYTEVSPTTSVAEVAVSYHF